MSQAPEPPDFAALAAQMIDLTGTKPLEARLAGLREVASEGDFGTFLTALAQAHAGEALSARVAMAVAHHKLAYGTTPPPEPGARLAGETRAVSLMLARALARLSQDDADAIFDVEAYMMANPDVEAAGVEPLQHYISSGAAEGRLPGGVTQADPSLADPNAFGPATMPALFEQAKPMYPRALRPSLRADALARVGQTRLSVSVIMPCWNRAYVVPNAVHAAFTQSYAPHEVIVVDDGSTDGGAELLEARYAPQVDSGQLKILRCAHKGVSAARNAGLRASTGEVIAYLDSDNLWEDDHLLYLVAALVARPELEAVYSGVVRHHLEDGWSDVVYRAFDADRLKNDNFIDLNGVAHRRALTERLGGFDEALERLVDWDLMLRFAAHTALQPVPVLSAHQVISGRLLSNISVTRDAQVAAARIAARHGADGPGRG